MENALNEIVTTIDQVANVPQILAGFVACLPWWIISGIGISVSCGVCLLILKVLGIK